jgi:hypothetical protein
MNIVGHTLKYEEHDLARPKSRTWIASLAGPHKLLYKVDARILTVRLTIQSMYWKPQTPPPVTKQIDLPICRRLYSSYMYISVEVFCDRSPLPARGLGVLHQVPHVASSEVDPKHDPESWAVGFYLLYVAPCMTLHAAA